MRNPIDEAVNKLNKKTVTQNKLVETSSHVLSTQAQHWFFFQIWFAREFRRVRNFLVGFLNGSGYACCGYAGLWSTVDAHAPTGHSCTLPVGLPLRWKSKLKNASVLVYWTCWVGCPTDCYNNAINIVIIFCIVWLLNKKRWLDVLMNIDLGRLIDSMYLPI